MGGKNLAHVEKDHHAHAPKILEIFITFPIFMAKDSVDLLRQPAAREEGAFLGRFFRTATSTASDGE
jgi:flavorubredoxin